jgi:hypothetical protein
MSNPSAPDNQKSDGGNLGHQTMDSKSTQIIPDPLDIMDERGIQQSSPPNTVYSGNSKPENISSNPASFITKNQLPPLISSGTQPQPQPQNMNNVVKPIALVKTNQGLINEDNNSQVNPANTSRSNFFSIAIKLILIFIVFGLLGMIAAFVYKNNGNVDNIVENIVSYVGRK